MIQRATIAHWLGGGFLAYAIACALLPPASPGFWAVHLGGLAVAYLVGAFVPGHRWAWLGYSILLSVVLALSLLGSYLNVLAPPGLFGNLNYLGAAFAIAVVAAVAYQIWFFLPIGIFGLWYSQSRGAILATGLTCLAMLWPRFRVTIIVAISLGLTVAMYKEDIGSSMLTRLGIWQDTVEHLTFLGNGWGTYLADYTSWPVRRNMTLLLAPHAYNDYLELLHNLGIGAILLFLLVTLSLDQPTTPRPIILCFLILGLTYFPFWIPGVGEMFAFALGSAIKETSNGTLAPYGLTLPERRRDEMGILGG